MNSEQKRIRKEWKKYNLPKEKKSKKEILIIIFWVCLLVYSIAKIILSIQNLFLYKASVDIVVKGEIISENWQYSTHGTQDNWFYSNSNKIFNIFIDLVILSWLIFIYSSIISKKINPSYLKIYLIITVVMIIYNIYNVAMYKQNPITKESIKNAWILSHLSEISRKNINPSEIQVIPNYMAFYSINIFAINLSLILIPTGLAAISFVAIHFYSDTDTIYF